MKPLSLNELLSWEPPTLTPIISSGILYPGTKMILFGKYKSWKSMLAIHTGFCIATGSNWLGYRTSRKRVLIIQLEIPQALFRNRLLTYCKTYDTQPDNIYFIYEPYLKLDRGFGVVSLEPVLSSLKPDVLIIDPLYKALSGNISDSTAAEQFQTNIDRLSHKYSFSTIIIAHTRQALTTPEGGVIDMGADEMMGSSNWPNWFDSVIRVSKTSDTPAEVTLSISFEAMRHATDLLPRLGIRVSRETLRWSVIINDVGT